MNNQYATRFLGNPRTKDSSNLPRNPRSRGQQLQASTDQLADYLVEKFQSPGYRPLFLKVAWRLDRGTIDRHVATAFELGHNKRAYFITLVKKEPKYYEAQQN